MTLNPALRTLTFVCVLSAVAAPAARAQTAQPLPFLCDIAYEDCRAEVLRLIRNETQGIDVSFWFMSDARYSNEIVKRWQLGVPVRVIMDPRANNSHPANAPILTQLKSAGIPMLNKPFGDIVHWKGMIFAGQNIAQFSGANYSPYEYVYQIPYVQYQDEAIYFSNEPAVVRSLMRRFDNVWMNTQYTFFANPITRVRSYDLFTIAPEFNFPPDDSYTDRLLPLINNETVGIDVVMFRITDPRPADALIRAVQRGVPVRLYHEPNEYRNSLRLDDSYNIDRMYKGGVQIKIRDHDGLSHQKSVQLIGQHTTIFGTSNWSTASDDNQLEVNYFTTKDWFYDFFAHQFEWKWNNHLPDGTPSQQTKNFVPLPPDTPKYVTPANLATGVATNTRLTWFAGFWARKYDIYLGTTSSPPLVEANVELGPSATTTDNKTYIPKVALLPGTTYYWRIVSKTMADLQKTGPVWSFTTAGTPSGDTVPPTVSVTAPTGGATLTGVATVTANATDNVGVASVQFKVDGVNVGAQDTAAPYSISWDSTSVPNGTHNITAQARDAAGNVATSTEVTVTVSNTTTVPTLPSGWEQADIGQVGATGNASFSSGTWQLSGSGADIWGTVDEFHFAYRTWSGDGEIVARVVNVSNTNEWTKTGVMMRSSLSPNASHASMFVSPGRGLAFQRRTASGGVSVNTSGGPGTAPVWLKLSRAGNDVTASVSFNGVSWNTVATDTIALGTTIYVGLPLTSHSDGVLASASVDSVSVGGETPVASLPAGWANQDIGQVGAPGAASYADAVYRVTGSGEDIWGAADAFHFGYRALAGDGEIVARVANVSNTDPWTKAGVMMRGSLAAGASHASMFVTPGKGLAFQRRPASGGLSVNTSGGLGTAPMWVRLERAGSTVTASVSSDGALWSVVGTDTIELGATVYVGLAVTSHVQGELASSTLDNVVVGAGT